MTKNLEQLNKNPERKSGQVGVEDLIAQNRKAELPRVTKDLEKTGVIERTEVINSGGHHFEVDTTDVELAKNGLEAQRLAARAKVEAMKGISEEERAIREEFQLDMAQIEEENAKGIEDEEAQRVALRQETFSGILGLGIV